MHEAMSALHESFGPNELTEPQQELYKWICAYIEKTGHSPAIREMMRAMRLKSPAPIQSRLKFLEKKGWIEKREKNGKPGIWPTAPEKGASVFIKREALLAATMTAPDNKNIGEWINELIQFAAKEKAKEFSKCT
jgi:hypothetical protein